MSRLDSKPLVQAGSVADVVLIQNGEIIDKSGSLQRAALHLPLPDASGDSLRKL